MTKEDVWFALGLGVLLLDTAIVFHLLSSPPPAAPPVTMTTETDILDRLADAIIRHEGHPSGGLRCAGQPGVVCENGYVVGATAKEMLRRDLEIKFRRWVRDDLMENWCEPGPCAYRDELLEELKGKETTQ